MILLLDKDRLTELDEGNRRVQVEGLSEPRGEVSCGKAALTSLLSAKR